MTYSIIGSGNIGSGIARQFARKGLKVAIANTRGPASIAALGEQLGRSVVAQTLEAALKASTVILAVPYPAIGTMAGLTNWSDKIVVDATNAIDFPAFTPTDLHGRPSSEVLAEKLRGARVVKAFNTLPAAVVAADPIVGAGRRVLFISGNDPEANNEIAGLVETLDFAPVVLGRLNAGGLLQQFGGALTIQNLIKLG